jgi:hypothetical protein
LRPEAQRRLMRDNALAVFTRLPRPKAARTGGVRAAARRTAGKAPGPAHGPAHGKAG